MKSFWDDYAALLEISVSRTHNLITGLLWTGDLGKAAHILTTFPATIITLMITAPYHILINWYWSHIMTWIMYIMDVFQRTHANKWQYLYFHLFNMDGDITVKMFYKCRRKTQWFWIRLIIFHQPKRSNQSFYYFHHIKCYLPKSVY